jgi:hypothetical protein
LAKEGSRDFALRLDFASKNAVRGAVRRKPLQIA